MKIKHVTCGLALLLTSVGLFVLLLTIVFCCCFCLEFYDDEK